MKVYVRKEEKYTEAEQYGGGALKFLYTNAFGRILLRLAVSRSVSNIYAVFYGRRFSARKIPEFIKRYEIDMSDYEDREYKSFNDFFVRKFKEGARTPDPDPNAFIAPADSKLLSYRIDEELRLNIKGSSYSLDELVGDGSDLEGFKGGHALIFRLCMDNCHRYCFADDGTITKHYAIKGRLHTVSPISKAFKIYKENTREVSFLSTANFGEIITIEVGALLVGRIKNMYPDTFKKGDEKGYFEPGGSTIVVLTKGGIVEIDEDICRHSGENVETQVEYGEKIGRKIC